MAVFVPNTPLNIFPNPNKTLLRLLCSGSQTLITPCSLTQSFRFAVQPSLTFCSRSRLLMAMNIWKRLSTAMPPVAFAVTVKSHITFLNFRTQIATPSPERDVVTAFLVNRCGLSQEDIAKAFRHHKGLLLRAKSRHNMEEALELLNGCGLTNPSQIRRVVLSNPEFLFSSVQRNIKPKLTLLGTFMKKEDIFKLTLNEAGVFRSSEDTLKSAISLLQRLGVEGPAASELVGRQPRLLTTAEEKVVESFKQIESLGIKKGSKGFATAMRSMLGLGKEHIDRRLQCLRCLGFSEKQILEISRKTPVIFAYSEENLKRHVHFLVKSAGYTFADLLKYPNLLGYSMEKRIIPRLRVMEALKTTQVLKTELIGPQLFLLTEEQFLEKYVNKNAEPLVLRDIYHWVKDGQLSIDEESCAGSDVVSRLAAVEHYMKAGKLSVDKGTRNESDVEKDIHECKDSVR